MGGGFAGVAEVVWCLGSMVYSLSFFQFMFNQFRTVYAVLSQIFSDIFIVGGTAVARWLKCCATNWKVTGSIPAGVSEFFIDIKSFRSHYDPGVNSASKRNEYQEYFLGVKLAGV